MSVKITISNLSVGDFLEPWKKEYPSAFSVYEGSHKICILLVLNSIFWFCLIRQVTKVLVGDSTGPCCMSFLYESFYVIARNKVLLKNAETGGISKPLKLVLFRALAHCDVFARQDVQGKSRYCSSQMITFPILVM